MSATDSDTDAPVNTCPVCHDEYAYLGPSSLCPKHREEYEREVRDLAEPSFVETLP